MVVTFLLMLVVGMLVAIFRSEFEAWMPWIAERLRRAALSRLPNALRERLDEEWASHLDETPGYIGKVWQAFGFNIAARKISFSRMVWIIKGRIVDQVLYAVVDTGRVMLWVGKLLLRRSKNHSHYSRVATKIAVTGIVITLKSEAIARHRAEYIADDTLRQEYLSNIGLAYTKIRRKLVSDTGDS